MHDPLNGYFIVCDPFPFCYPPRFTPEYGDSEDGLSSLYSEPCWTDNLDNRHSLVTSVRALLSDSHLFHWKALLKFLGGY